MKIPEDVLRGYDAAIRAQFDRDIAAMYTPYTPRSSKFTMVQEDMRRTAKELAQEAERPIATSFHAVTLPFTRDQTIDMEGDFLRWSEPKPRTPAREALIDLRRGEGYTYGK